MFEVLHLISSLDWILFWVGKRTRTSWYKRYPARRTVQNLGNNHNNFLCLVQIISHGDGNSNFSCSRWSDHKLHPTLEKSLHNESKKNLFILFIYLYGMSTNNLKREDQGLNFFFSSWLQDTWQLFKPSWDPSSATKTSSSGWSARASSWPRQRSSPPEPSGSTRGSSSRRPAERCVGSRRRASEGQTFTSVASLSGNDQLLLSCWLFLW